MKTTILLVFVLVSSPVVAWKLGERAMEQRLATRVAEAQQTSDSLKLELASALRQVFRDTVRIDSIVDRWREAKVQYLRDTVRDTLWRDRVVALADSTVAAVDSGRRVCLNILSTCQVALTHERGRADTLSAMLATVREAAMRGGKWRSAERTICAASLVGNFAQWRAR